MTVQYQVQAAGRRQAIYACQQQAVSRAEPVCQHVRGGGIDRAIGALLLELMEPLTLELALSVQREVQQRLEEADQLRRQQVERARYQADLARERFMSVDPRNRLVADQLEADWNEKLRELERARELCEAQRAKDRVKLDEVCRQKILSLVRDFPRVWNDPATPDQERKRLIRLLLEDVTLTRGVTHTLVQVRLRGGQTRTLEVAHPLHAGLLRKTSGEVVRQIDALLEEYTEGEVAAELNRRGVKPSQGEQFSERIIGKLRRSHGLASRYDRLRRRGLLTQEELAEALGVHPLTIRVWRAHGLLRGYAYNDKGERLYERPAEENRPVKSQGQELSERAREMQVTLEMTNEVQHET